MTRPITTALDPEQQRVTGEALQGAVVDLIDLSLLGKQAHWNVIGSHFRSVHLALDDLVLGARDFTDTAAERATAIGVSPDGRARTVAEHSVLKGISEGWQRDNDVISTVTANLAAVIGRMRERVEATDKSDPVTQDLMIEVTTWLEKQHWMWQAQFA